MILVTLLLLLAQGHQPSGPVRPHTCSGAIPSDFPAPPPPSCPPDTSPVPGCYAACVANYQQEMVELTDAVCQIRHNLTQDMVAEIWFECKPPFDQCWAKCYPNTQSCTDMLDFCIDQIEQEYDPQFQELEELFAEATASVAAQLESCYSSCCQ